MAIQIGLTRRLGLLVLVLSFLVPVLPTDIAEAGTSTAALQQALKDKGFYRGAVDGSYGSKTQYAVMAFRKEIGATRSFSWSNSLWDDLEIYQAPYTEHDEPDRLEINLTKQTAHLFRGGELKATFPIASGNGEIFANLYGNPVRAVTPTGSYTVFRREYGWYTSYLGSLYNPWFFNGGIAIHGSNDVPAYPASHGCVRLTIWDSNFLNQYMFMGMPVHVFNQPSGTGPVYASDGPFADVPADHTFAAAVQWMVDADITDGCRLYFYCPDVQATRGTIAAFMKRALGPYLGPAPPAEFADTEGHVFENAIEWLAGHGITKGCNPPANTNFCPDRTVSRGEMAAMFMRAADDLIAISSESINPDRFVDTQGHTFQNASAWLAAAKVTLGCNPPANDEFCPDSKVTRAQLAAFLKRIVDRL